jgi:hypothetical protein
MSRAAWIQVLSQPLAVSLTRAQTVLACDVGSLYAAAAMLGSGGSLTGDQLAMLSSVREVLARDSAELVIHAPPEPDPAPGPGAITASQASAIADAAAVEQRGLLASTVANTLMAANWTVTLVDGGPPDRFTGIEATRGTEHLVLGVGHGVLIVDQAGVDDRDAVEVLAEGLREIGCVVAVPDEGPGERPDEGPGEGQGRTLYALRGGPSLAHAIQALLTYGPRPAVLTYGPRPAAQPAPG